MYIYSCSIKNIGFYRKPAAIIITITTITIITTPTTAMKRVILPAGEIG
jgi:hypothetical protein